MYCICIYMNGNSLNNCRIECPIKSSGFSVCNVQLYDERAITKTTERKFKPINWLLLLFFLKPTKLSIDILAGHFSIRLRQSNNTPSFICNNIYLISDSMGCFQIYKQHMCDDEHETISTKAGFDRIYFDCIEMKIVIIKRSQRWIQLNLIISNR